MNTETCIKLSRMNAAQRTAQLTHACYRAGLAPWTDYQRASKLLDAARQTFWCAWARDPRTGIYG